MLDSSSGHTHQQIEDLIHFTGIFLYLIALTKFLTSYRYFNAQEDHYNHSVRTDIEAVPTCLFILLLAASSFSGI